MSLCKVLELRHSTVPLRAKLRCYAAPPLVDYSISHRSKIFSDVSIIFLRYCGSQHHLWRFCGVGISYGGFCGDFAMVYAVILWHVFVVAFEVVLLQVVVVLGGGGNGWRQSNHGKIERGEAINKMKEHSAVMDVENTEGGNDLVETFKDAYGILVEP
ncbi:Hypothetical predicted protein [Olea europaea subsp. europaea]|uniref:Uncharacterized protein n=1 Tax=Olea europaea subsp. europaea TaxID=158383 RepID=A0A8S0QM80_OLEEU|nr:Hypothetical predicted protein [Olea europaea subsp. europaea]